MDPEFAKLPTLRASKGYWGRRTATRGVQAGAIKCARKVDQEAAVDELRRQQSVISRVCRNRSTVFLCNKRSAKPIEFNDTWALGTACKTAMAWEHVQLKNECCYEVTCYNNRPLHHAQRRIFQSTQAHPLSSTVSANPFLSSAVPSLPALIAAVFAAPRLFFWFIMSCGIEEELSLAFRCCSGRA